MMSYATKLRTTDPEQSRFEEARRAQLRSKSPIYLLFEGVIGEFAEQAERRQPAIVKLVAADLATAREFAAWNAPDYLGFVKVRAILWGCLIAAVGWLLWGGIFAAACGAAGYWIAERLQRADLAKRAAKRRRAIKRRFVNSLELLAIVMEVGGTFPEGVRSLVEEMRGHPLGIELEEVLRNLEAGKTLEDALEQFGARINDEDVTEFVYAVKKSHELGTPLAGTLRIQSEQMRLKRVQWAEKASEQAKVSIVFPAMLIMLACLLIVAAPFVLIAFQDYRQSM
jgi:tight adherence protein C